MTPAKASGTGSNAAADGSSARRSSARRTRASCAATASYVADLKLHGMAHRRR